jgi:hypothetical protein
MGFLSVFSLLIIGIAVAISLFFRSLRTLVVTLLGVLPRLYKSAIRLLLVLLNLFWRFFSIKESGPKNEVFNSDITILLARLTDVRKHQCPKYV